MTLGVKLEVPKQFEASHEVCQDLKTSVLTAFTCSTWYGDQDNVYI